MANITKIHLEDSNDFNRLAGGTITATVKFSEDVIVTDTPHLNMTVDMTNGPAVSEGNQARVSRLDYVSGSDTDTLTSTNIAGLLTTGTQTNITSVGTLTALSVTGNIGGGNVSVTNSQAIADAAGTCEVYTPA